MSLIDLSPDDLLEYADLTEDEAYNFPPGAKRQKLLTIAAKMRAYANRAKWDDTLVIKAEVSELPISPTRH